MPAPETRFAVLLFTDIVGSTELKARHGVPAYSEALRAHNGHFERISHERLNIRTLQSRGDGYFAEAGSIAEAVRFALLFEEAMRAGPWGEVRLAVRVGIHAGEVGTLHQEDGTWIVGPAADLAARITDLAMGGQILLTRFPFDEARHFIREHPPVAGKTMPPLRWLAHGPYLLKGRDEPMDVFEVGAEGLAPLTAPPDGDKAKRAIRPGEEETLGWRPAVGLEIPGRTGWQLTEKLGAGGFGEVWTGEHAKLHQRRAFKFCFDDERLRALKREVTLVRLLRSALGERDDIVHIHELKLDAPPFYLESDLAPHGNLLQWAESQGGLDKIPLTQRIALVAHTATALAAAHSIGVLHKDIKPTNILIFDGPGGEPRPRLVDFGIGTLADPAVLGEHGVTGAGFTRTKTEHSTGTPTYSPPEYLAGKPYTTLGDIYGLGVLLYQLVTAKPLEPLAHGWEREITDPLLREDIAECVDGDPARRLPSAADLAERLLTLDARRAETAEKERIAHDAATRAKAVRAALAARERARRLRRLVAAFAILTGLAIAAGMLAWINQQKAAHALDEVAERKSEVDRKNTELASKNAELNEKTADYRYLLLEVQKQVAVVDRKNAEYRAMLAEAARSDRLAAEDELRAGHEREAFAHLARACEYDPSSTLAAEKAAAALNVWHRSVPSAIFAGPGEAVFTVQFTTDEVRIVTGYDGKIPRVWDAVNGKCLVTLNGHEGDMMCAEFSADGLRIVTASKDDTAQVWVARVWDAATGKRLATFKEHGYFLTSARFSPDGKRIVTASADDTARVWDAASGKTLAILAGHKNMVCSAEFSPDGSRIVTASVDKTARVWDAKTGKSLGILAGHPDGVRHAHFSSNGSRIVTASRDKTARVWNSATFKSLATLEGYQADVLSAEFSPNGSRIVTASEDKTARVWDAASGKSLATLAGHQARVLSAEFSPDGSRIVTASEDKTARVWDAATGRSLAILTGHIDFVLTAQFSPDGKRIVTTARDQTARVWDAAAINSLTALTGHKGNVTSTQFSPDGTRIVTVSDDKTAQVWDAATGKSLATLAGHKDKVSSAEFSLDGTRIVTVSDDKTARLWDTATGKSLATLAGRTDKVLSAGFSPDGTRIVTASDDKTARIWDAATGENLAALIGHKDKVLSAGFSLDGAHIVTASEDKTATVWDAATGKGLATLTGHEEGVNGARFSPDGLRIVTNSGLTAVWVWETATGMRLAILGGKEASVYGGEFSPDSGRIVTMSGDPQSHVQVWDAATGKSLVIISGQEGEMGSASFSPDGSRILTASEDTVARVWEAATGKSIATLEGHQDEVSSAEFTPDGSRIVTTSADKTARVWEAATGRIIAILAAEEEDLEHAQLSPNGSHIVTAFPDTAPRIWTLLPPTAGPPPEWFADFLRYLAQMRLNSDGELEMLKPDDWLALRERMRGVRRAGAGQDTPYLRILRRFVPE